MSSVSHKNDQHEHPDDAHDHAQEHAHIGLKTYYTVFVALLVLMAATIGAYYLENIVDMPRALGITIAVAIASAKTALIVYYFMHVKISSRLVQLFAAAGFVFLLILFGVTMGDYLARDWPPQLEGPLR